MTRNEFIRRLRSGLKGMPAAEQAEMVADYEAHFDAGAAEGRSEIEIAEALGNPGRLARELRLEAGIKQWREDRSPSAAWTAVVGILGLATIDILILVPIILPIIAVIFALYVASAAVFFAGGVVMLAGPFADSDVIVNGFAVFLLGLVTQREADDAVDIARTTGGVQKVVRLFEIIGDDEARRLDLTSSESKTPPAK